MNAQLPFSESLVDNFYYRKFSSDVESESLLWHRDEEDRIIESVNETDWKFQFDNELPIKFSGKIFIKAEIYHRIIKGSGDLILKIEKINIR